MNEVAVTSFYRFTALSGDGLPSLRDSIHSSAAELGLRGLVLLACEGLNGTLAGARSAIEEIKCRLCCAAGCQLDFKDSSAPSPPFARLSVQIREEIVTLGRHLPSGPPSEYLTPQEWDAALADPDTVVLDTRNRYETRIGRFKGAIDPDLERFSDLPAYLDRAGIPKDRKVLMYCTGGIRCEKAAIEMKIRGYGEVFQLGGGILRYLEERPDGAFEGECFVFDRRVALDRRLKPTIRYKLCPHCGDPGADAIECDVCGGPAVICSECGGDYHLRTCSKNCSHHSRLGTPRRRRGHKKK